jgi:hypothetical protein
MGRAPGMGQGVSVRSAVMGLRLLGERAASESNPSQVCYGDGGGGL